MSARDGDAGAAASERAEPGVGCPQYSPLMFMFMFGHMHIT